MTVAELHSSFSGGSGGGTQLTLKLNVPVFVPNPNT